MTWFWYGRLKETLAISCSNTYMSLLAWVQDFFIFVYVNSMKTTVVWLAILSSVILLMAGCGQTSSVQTTKLAQCMTNKGVTMYGTSRCPHCQKQKELFGEGFSKVNFVDCDNDKNTCALAGVKWYPTWAFADGSVLMGEQTLETLAAKSGCGLDGSVLTGKVVSTGTVVTGTQTSWAVVTWSVSELSGEVVEMSGTVATGN